MLMPAGNEFETATQKPLTATSQPGALPAPLRALSLVRTGPYLHQPAFKQHISFKTEGDVDRSFTILIAAAVQDNAIHLDRNGIVVIDNDNWAVLADEIQPQSSGIRGASGEQRKAFEAIASLNWTEFTHLLHSCENFRQDVAADIATRSETPSTGNATRQIALGLRKADDIDLRDDFLRAIHAAGDYNFPRATRRSMINDLLMHPSVETREGRRLSWDVRMNFTWNKTGRVPGGEEVDAEGDTRWMEAIASDPCIVTTACERAMAPYLAGPFSALDMDDAACDLEARGPNGGTVVLNSFDGKPMGFADPRALRARLSGMDDDALMRLWAATRVLDADFGRKNRAAVMELELNSLRAELEPSWEDDVEPELTF